MQRASIADTVYSSLRKAKPAGDGYVIACCPVHKNGQERNPSFSVNVRSGSYRCFSCGIHGGVDDLKKLLGAPHLYVQKEDIKKEEEAKENDVVNPAILEVFDMCPLDLVEEGFYEQTLRDHRIGYDTHLRRITFPIFASDGRLVAISGRGEKGVEPRYKVYTWQMLRGAADEYYAPKPKDHLYGGNTVSYSDRPVVLVEGYKACLWVRQAGFGRTVASMGTAVTPEQLKRLRHIANRVIILFDMDAPGIKASRKVQKDLLGMGTPSIPVFYQSTKKKEPSPDDLTTDELHSVLGKFY